MFPETIVIIIWHSIGVIIGFLAGAGLWRRR